MHTTATDGRNTIAEMAEAAIARGLQYIAITDHSKNLAMINGLDEKRALEHITNIREVDKQMKAASASSRHRGRHPRRRGPRPRRRSARADGRRHRQRPHAIRAPRDEMTARILRAVENPNTRILGHPTGRHFCAGSPIHSTSAPFFAARRTRRRRRTQAAPERLDLSDRDLRLAKEMRLQDRHQHRCPRHPHRRQDGGTASASSAAPGSPPPTCSIPCRRTEFLAASFAHVT